MQRHLSCVTALDPGGCLQGADAVYFGLTLFNARARANNFAPEELEEVMRYLRERGVKGYVTLNTLVFDEELAEVEAYIRHICRCGVDAVIVQVCTMAQTLNPNPNRKSLKTQSNRRRVWRCGVDAALSRCAPRLKP